MQSAALYIRVSTDEQSEYSPNAQKRLLTEYAMKNNILISNEYVFIDEGISGRKAEKRPAFMKMIATAKKKPKPFDLILVHKFDRFSRSREDSIVYKSLLKRECGIQVISITESIEDDKFSVILEAMLEAMAEYYSLNLSDEVTKGMTEKALRGEYQTAAPLGYDMKDGKLFINDKQSKVVLMIFDEYLNKNATPFKIARQLNSLGVKTIRNNKFDTRAVRYILKNPVYCGQVRWNVLDKSANKVNDETEWIIVKGEHEPIIEEKVFNDTQEKLIRTYDTTKKSRPRDINKHWLSGILKCSNCGKGLVYADTKKYKGFQCWLYSKGKCDISHFIAERKVVNAVYDALNQILSDSDVDYTVEKRKRNTGDLKIFKEQLKKLDIKEKRIKDAYINEIDTLEEYRINRELITKERKEVKNKIESFTNDDVEISKEILISKISDVYNIIISDKYSKEEKNASLLEIVDKIVYNKPNNSIHIHFYF